MMTAGVGELEIALRIDAAPLGPIAVFTSCSRITVSNQKRSMVEKTTDLFGCSEIARANTVSQANQLPA